MDVHPTKNVSIGIDPYPYEWDMNSILTWPILDILDTSSLQNNEFLAERRESHWYQKTS